MSNLVPLRTVDLLDRHNFLNILIEVFSLPTSVFRLRLIHYKLEMAAIERTRVKLETMLAEGNLRDDMTIEELRPIWEAELDRQRHNPS